MPRCTHDLADLLCRRSSPSNYFFFAQAFFGGSEQHNPFSALALSGGGGVCTRDACTCASSLMRHLESWGVAMHMCWDGYVYPDCSCSPVAHSLKAYALRRAGAHLSFNMARDPGYTHIAEAERRLFLPVPIALRFYGIGPLPVPIALRFCGIGSVPVPIALRFCANCSLTSIFSSGRQWTPSGRSVDALVDAQWTVKEILACDTNPTNHHHNS